MIKNKRGLINIWRKKPKLRIALHKTAYYNEISCSKEYVRENNDYNGINHFDLYKGIPVM